MSDLTAETGAPADPYCPDHGSRPTAYDSCSCEGRARVLAAQVISACDAVGIPHDVPALIRHHRGNAALAAAMNDLTTRSDRADADV